MAYLLNTILGTLVPMCITALVTMAITMIFKTSSTTNFAQGVISAFGAYVVANFMMAREVSIWLALPVGMLVSTALAVDVVIFRNGRYVNALGKQIITMGLISLVVGVTPLVFGLATPSIGTFASGTLSFPLGDKSVVITVNSLICVALVTAATTTASTPWRNLLTM